MAEPMLKAVDEDPMSMPTAMPVFEVIMELAQGVKVPLSTSRQNEDHGGETGMTNKHNSGLDPLEVAADSGPAAMARGVWDVPPRYKRLQQQRSEQRAHETYSYNKASARSMLWGSAALAAETIVKPSESASILLPLEDLNDERELLRTSAMVSVPSEELMRRPPTVTAYRIIPLSDCPLSIQRRAHIDELWLQQLPFDQSVNLYAVLPTLFLCWCRLYAHGSDVLLFSDAVVLQRPNKEGVIRSRQQLAVANVGQPPVSSSIGSSLPLHYLQHRVHRQQEDARHSRHMDDDYRMVQLIAQQQLQLEIELKDRQRSLGSLPDAYIEDRLGLPRTGIATPSGQQDVGSAAARWVKVAHERTVSKTESRTVFNALSPSGDASPTRAASASRNDLQLSRAEGNTTTEEAFCVPQRRVRMGELGRFVPAPAATDSLDVSGGGVNLSAYWMQSTSSNNVVAEEANAFTAAGRYATMPFQAVDTSPTATRAQLARRRVAQRANDRLRRHQTVTEASSGNHNQTFFHQQPIVAYSPGNSMLRQRFGAVSPAPEEKEEEEDQYSGSVHPAFTDEWGLQGRGGENMSRVSSDHPQTFAASFANPSAAPQRSLSPTDSRHSSSAQSRASMDLLLSTIRQLAPLRQSADSLAQRTQETSRRVEELLDGSADSRFKMHAAMVQALNAETKLVNFIQRADALQERLTKS